MKKALVSFLLIISFILCGCSSNRDYYISCKEAFLANSKNNPTVNEELHTVVLDTDTVLWVAVTTDIVRSGNVATILMDLKDGMYRVSDRSSSGESYLLLKDAECVSFSESGWHHTESYHGKKHFFWQWCATDLVTDEMIKDFQCRNFTFKYADTEYDLTLIIYTIELKDS